LTAATLGYVHVSVPLIESIVALSIVFVAAELQRFWQGTDGATTQYPGLVSFAFGLLHGFAFAGSLTEIGLPPQNIPGALLLFNCGVEIGQVIFVVAVLAAIAASQRLNWAMTSRGRLLVSYSLGTLASYWMIARVIMLIR
jgi:hypothetical protein